jgi:hypothetical protein
VLDAAFVLIADAVEAGDHDAREVTTNAPPSTMAKLPSTNSWHDSPTSLPRLARHPASSEYPRQPHCYPSSRSGTASSRRGATKSRSQLAAPTERRSVTSQPAPNLARLYPELGQDGTLQIALQKAVHQAGYRFDVLPNELRGGSDQEPKRTVAAGRRALTWASRSAASS